MKRYFQMLDDPRFHLLYGVTQRFSDGPEPRSVRLNREGFTLEEGVKKGSMVHPYMLLATHPSPLKGDLFASIYGRISEINERSIFVDAVEPDDALRRAGEAAARNTVDLLSGTETGEELRPILKRMGLNTKSLGQTCETLIINGLNPDPGVMWAEPMLLSHRGALMAGIALLRRLSPARRIILAVPREMRLSYDGLEVAPVPSQYPASINALVIRAVTGRENPEGVGIVGLHNIWSLGRVGRTGLPLIETVLTIGSLEHSGNYVVRDGSKVGEILDFANIVLNKGDTLVRGGPLRGESLERLDRSVTKGSAGVFVVEAGAIPPMEGHSPCISCGACVLICPARLNPGFLSRYAEFALHERNIAENIDCCMECGLCGYVCLSRRPVLQYIRLSKRRLAQMEAARRAAETEEGGRQ